MNIFDDAKDDVKAAAEAPVRNNALRLVEDTLEHFNLKVSSYKLDFATCQAPREPSNPATNLCKEVQQEYYDPDEEQRLFDEMDDL